ncbi:mitochondrial glycoprotein family protein [Actinidia rufa]|uniref:Mitochondrial glycoprotein family protein n=1 Tax=Actinidia rufa TaxID=165716 RepID=A0A7J0EAV5_9ERIC|nr:mitochondrial glycoprotein family protein [Actinidia rufa]
MAFASILRRSASAVVPLAIRAIGGQRYHHHCSALLSPPTAVFSLGVHFLQSFTTRRPRSGRVPTSPLLRVIETEIKCAQESEDHDQADDVPDGFPFKIEDNPGQQTISLCREYQGENILVEVHMPDLVTGDNGEDDDVDDTEKSNQSSIPLVVRVSKKNGPCLEFGVTAFPDEISIDSLSVKDPQNSEDQIPYEGPDFSDLDENLQKGFSQNLKKFIEA